MNIKSIQNSRLIINNAEISLTDTIFYVSFAMAYAVFSLNSTYIGSLMPGFIYIYRGTAYLSMLTGTAIFFVSAYKENRVKILFGTMILAAAYVYFISGGDISVSIFLVFCFAANRKRFRTIAFTAFFITLFNVLTVYFASASGYIKYSMEKGFNELGTKYAFGFYNGNALSIYIFFILLMYCYLRPFDRIVFLYADAIIFPFTAFFVERYSGGRTSFVIIIFLALGTAIYRLAYLVKNGKVFEKIGEGKRKAFAAADSYFHGLLFGLSSIICITASFVTAFMYGMQKSGGILRIVDKVFDSYNLKSRLMVSWNAISTYSPRILGKSVENGFFWIDNYYIRLIYKHGILIFISMTVIMLICQYRNWKRKNYYVMFLLALIAALGFMEAAIGEMQYNIFPLMVFAVLDNKDKS